MIHNTEEAIDRPKGKLCTDCLIAEAKVYVPCGKGRMAPRCLTCAKRAEDGRKRAINERNKK